MCVDECEYWIEDESQIVPGSTVRQDNLNTTASSSKDSDFLFKLETLHTTAWKHLILATCQDTELISAEVTVGEINKEEEQSAFLGQILQCTFPLCLSDISINQSWLPPVPLQPPTSLCPASFPWKNVSHAPSRFLKSRGCQGRENSSED